MTSRTIIVGDVHGCLTELLQLLRKELNIQREDHLVFVGDLVDKGPDSAGVVRYVRSLSTQGYQVSLVLGNHEEAHLRWLSKPEDKRHVMKKHEEIKKIQARMNADDIAFLRSARLFLPLPELSAIVVHAGIPESLQSLPSQEDLAAMSRRKYKQALNACRLRYVTPEGHFVSLSNIDTSKHIFWAERYDGRFGHAYYGHEALNEKVRQDGHATGIDLGCVYGGKLAAAVLYAGGKREFVSVDMEPRIERKYD